MGDFEAARHNMVDSQIRTNKVTDPAIIAAMRAIPRERFVDGALSGIAYLDEDLPVAGSRYLMEPMVLARMLQTLAIRLDDVVLDIGAATGYSSAVISRLAAAVVAVESDPELAELANGNTAEFGLDNVVIVERALATGNPAQAPYDAIILQGAVAEVPRAIIEQLADGGRLCAVVREHSGQGKATLMVRTGTAVSSRVIFDANTPPLPGFERAVGFAF